MALTKVTGSIIKQPFNIGIATATSLNASEIVVSGISTLSDIVVGGATTELVVTGSTHVTNRLDVDGHTELDNVNISGVVTATTFVGPVTGNLTGNVTGNTSGTAGGLTGSPSITVTNITASGNVSIAGTLTYEDVTNIDSVGIVTARSGIHVTGGSVGIGTNNPAEALEVYGDARFKAPDGSHGIELFSDIGSLGYQRIISWNRTTSVYENLSIGANDLIIGPNFERLRITSAGLVGISSTVPKTDVDISQKTGAVALPQGTTAQRPTGSAPYIRKNSTNNALEFYNGTNWVEIITDYFPTGSTTLG